MNQIIGPKLSKSDTFYESLLTAFSSENGCVGQGLSDPSVFRQLENDRNRPGDCTHNLRASEFALKQLPGDARHSAARSPSCFAAVTARQKPRTFQNAAIARRFQQAVQTLSGRPQGQKGRRRSGLGKQTLASRKRPRTSHLIPWPFRC